jgi:hypothetical protein
MAVAGVGCLRSYPDSSGQLSCRSAFLSIAPDDPSCGFRIDQNGAFYFRNKRVADRIPVSFGSDGTITYAGSMQVFPASPDERHYFMTACESGAAKSAEDLCWRPFLFDTENGKLAPVYAGKYGPLKWIRWTSDGAYGVVLSSNKGAYWIHILKPLSHEAVAFPSLQPPDPGAPITELHDLHPESFKWLGPRSFEIKTQYRLVGAAETMEAKAGSKLKVEIVTDDLRTEFQ